MRILAIETSCLPGTVALLDGDQLLFQADLPSEDKTIQTLTPFIERLLAQANWQPQDLDLIAVSVGPGSFTGLRIGVMTAKCLAYATEAKVLGINTLRAIAQQAPGEFAHLHVIMDAQRKQLFEAIYTRTPATLKCLQDVQIVNNADWLAGFPHSHRVTGPGLERLHNEVPRECLVKESLWTPTAESVGLLAYQEAQAGNFHDLWALAPQYYRASAAEEKLQQDQSNQSD